MGEHGALHHVSNGVDVRVGGAQVAIHLHAAAVIEGDAGFVQPEPLGVGLAAHRHEAVIRFPGDFLAFLVVGLDDGLVAGIDHLLDAVAEVELDADLLHGALELLAHRAVHRRDDGVLVLHHVDLGAEAGVD